MEILTKTPYDHAFKTMLSDAVGTVIYLLIELFKKVLEANGIRLTGNESMERLATEICITDDNGEQRKEIVDSVLKVVDEIFHIECESTLYRMTSSRMYKYGAEIFSKLWSAEITPKHLFQGVIFLRSNSNTPDVLTIPDFVPGISSIIEYPILKLSDYSAEDIIKKRLYFLIPFYIFNYEESFDEIEKGNKDIFRG